MPSPSIATRSRAQASAAARKPKTKTQIAFERRQVWIDAVQCRRDLSPSARMIGSRLGSHKNLKTGQCNPGIRTLATEAAIAERSAFRAIVELERKGWIKVARSRGGRMSDANGYTLIMPKAAATADSVSAVPPAESPLTLCQPNLEDRSGGNATHSPPLGESDEPSVRDPGSARTALEGAAAEPSRAERYVEAEPGGTAPKGWRREDDPTTRTKVYFTVQETLALAEDGGVHAAWRALVALWAVRPWLMKPRELAIARAIFVRLIAEGVPIDAILAGAGAWVRGIDDPRYLMALPQWLAARGWERRPPPKRARRASRWQRPRSVAEAMADLARGAAS